ncbi:MAG: DNA translocase FtsK [Tannerella sp.]|jgi:S-DNA-T family DNA segregation ATPase FtsK/SpoIIIE|nr:DNA translocase FtsK [Tannerella sp.]
MAKKTTKKKRPENNDIEDILESISVFFTNERVRFLIGLILIFLVIYVSIASISFFFTGGEDQNAVVHTSTKDLLINRGQVNNWAGVRGAYVAELLMNRCFGISSFFILFFLGSLGVKWMGICRMSLLKRFLLCSAMLLWSAVFLSFTFLKSYEDTFLYLGGEQGFYLSDLLIKNLGKTGTILLLIAGFLIIAVCLSNKVIPLLRKFFSFSWSQKWKRKWQWKWKWPAWKTKAGTADRKAVDDEEDTEDDKEGMEEDVPEEDEEHHGTTTPEDRPWVTHVPAGDKGKPDIEFIINVPTGDDEMGYETAGNDLPPVVRPKATTNNDNEPYDESAMGDYDPRLDLSSYRFPPLDLLKKYDQGQNQINKEEQTDNQKRIKQTLEDFGINISSINATVGPTLTLYEVVPAVGVRISKIRNLEDDIALSLSALGIRIIAPMPGKGTIGIEVPNKDAQIVSMHSLIASRKFNECKYDLPVALGRTITNDVFMFDLCKAPHLLMAGATGQGKSVGLNAIITSLLYKKHPAELKFVMVDPKMVEFSIYEAIERHYLAKLPDEDKAIITDYTKVVYTLNSLCKEMDDRYELLTKAHVRNIKEYNEKFINRRLNPEKGHRFMPYIVVVIDEFGDLIMMAGKDIEMPIARIAQKARAIGIHMIIATQRPTTTIITGNIKANFPARVAFRVTTMVDSRTILDSKGANQLIGRGDLLFSQGSEMTRVQCAFVDTPEIQNVVSYIGQQAGYQRAYGLPEYLPEGEDKMPGNLDLSDRDPLFDEAARLIVIQQQGSTSLIQRKFSIGYNRAGRLMDQLERAGIVGPVEGSKARQVLIPDEYTLEQKFMQLK